MNYVHSREQINIADISASFQMAVIDVLLFKTLEAAKKYDHKRIAITGGVACNTRLRKEAGKRLGAFKRYIPSPKLCSDNAAMIAGIGFEFFKKGYSTADLNANVNPNCSLLVELTK